MSKSYQNDLHPEVKGIDQLGEQKAAETTVENYGVHQEMVTTQHKGMTVKTAEGTFGMVPEEKIDIGYTHERGEYFRKMAEDTGSRREPLTGMSSARDTAAYKSQTRMAGSYAADLSRLPEVQQNFDLFVPMANMAARSYQKTNEVADWLGFSDQQGPELNEKDNAALGKASKDKRGGVLDEGASLHLAAQGWKSARMQMVGASHKLASVVKSEAVQKLQADLGKATDRKEEIQAQVEQAGKIGEYIETAGTIIAGGGGLAGLSGATGAGKVETIGDSVEKTGSLGGKAAAFGVELYHAKELNQIHTKIDVITGMLKTHEQQSQRRAIEAAKVEFDKAAHDYKTAVETYEAAINDRRKNMAAMGANADKGLGKAGKDGHVSEAMLYTTTVLETQSFLDLAIEAANAAKKSSDTTGNEVLKERKAPWGMLSDVYGGDNTPRSEQLDAPDVGPMRQMQNLIRWWLEGATQVKDMLDGVVARQANPVLDAAGYDGKY